MGPANAAAPKPTPNPTLAAEAGVRCRVRNGVCGGGRAPYPPNREYDPSTRSMVAYSPRWSRARRAVSSPWAPRKSM